MRISDWSSDVCSSDLMITGYLAAEGFEDQLRHELGGRLVAEHGRLLLADTVIDAAWAANTWFDVQEVPIESIGDAATKLKAIQRNWEIGRASCRERVC